MRLKVLERRKPPGRGTAPSYLDFARSGRSCGWLHLGGFASIIISRDLLLNGTMITALLTRSPDTSARPATEAHDGAATGKHHEQLVAGGTLLVNLPEIVDGEVAYRKLDHRPRARPPTTGRMQGPAQNWVTSTRAAARPVAHHLVDRVTASRPAGVAQWQSVSFPS